MVVSCGWLIMQQNNSFKLAFYPFPSFTILAKVNKLFNSYFCFVSLILQQTSPLHTCILNRINTLSEYNVLCHDKAKGSL